MFDKEFKKALQELPSTEKDKLILRLLKKDLVLANQLLFQLVDTDTVEQKRVFIENELTRYLNKSADRFYRLGVFLMDMRFASGKINDHVAITKDKYGEISLNIQFLIESIKHTKLYILNSKPKDSYTLCIYIIARAFKILLLIKAQHEDLHLDFKESVEKLGNLIGENEVLMRFAINNGLDVNWLINFEIPENIVAIHKEIRANGFLK
jgi:hypothetical protein